MPTTVKRRVKTPKPAKRRKSGSAWPAWMMVICGIVAIPFALRGAGILALSGPGALAMLYPFVVLVNSAVLSIPRELANPAAQALMYAQFPLYGLLGAWVHRSRGIWIALNAVVWLHILAWGVAALLTHVQNPYLKFF